MWKLFDFGHKAGIKKLQDAMGKLLKETDEENSGWLKNPADCGKIINF